MNNQYTIIAKEVKNLLLESVVLENDNHETKRVTIDRAIELAKNNRLSNAKAILDTKTLEYKLYITEGLKNIDDIETLDNEIIIIGRLVDNNKCVGYKVRDKKGSSYKISSKKAWELVNQGLIKGLNAKIVDNRKVIISTDTLKLKELPVLNI